MQQNAIYLVGFLPRAQLYWKKKYLEIQMRHPSWKSSFDCSQSGVYTYSSTVCPYSIWHSNEEDITVSKLVDNIIDVTSEQDIEGLFRTQSNIYNGAFLRKWSTVFSRWLFSQKSFIIDVWLNPKYASGILYVNIHLRTKNNKEESTWQY